MSNLEIDPNNTFPVRYHKNLEGDISLERQTLSLILRGTFLDVGAFLEKLENAESPLKLQSCSISTDSLDPRGVIAQIFFATYTSTSS